MHILHDDGSSGTILISRFYENEEKEKAKQDVEKKKTNQDEEEALIQAAQKGDAETVSNCISSGVDIETKVSVSSPHVD